MGLSWQQGPLGRDPNGRFLTPDASTAGLPYAEPLRRRMSVELGGRRIVTSDEAVLVFEPDRYPVAYFPLSDVEAGALETTDRVTQHALLGPTHWFTVGGGGGRRAPRGAWQHVAPPPFAAMLRDTVAFAWRGMDAFYEEDERILGHAADPYHRIDVRTTSRHLTVHAGERLVAETDAPLVLYESGFAPRWYVPSADVHAPAIARVEHQTFCPYKGIASYYDVEGVERAAWSYRAPIDEMARIAQLISFEPDRVTVTIDGRRLHPERGQQVAAHGPDRNLTVGEGGGLTPDAR